MQEQMCVGKRRQFHMLYPRAWHALALPSELAAVLLGIGHAQHIYLLQCNPMVFLPELQPIYI